MTAPESLLQNSGVDLYREIVRIREEGRRGALATIVRRIGSVPRKDSAKMLVREDGSFLGSVGGGCVEAEVWEKAREVIRTGLPTFVHYEMKDEDAEAEGLVCGGTVEIFVEPIMSDPKLVILGAGHLGQAISRSAQEIGFEVTVVDDRERFLGQDRFPGVEQLICSDYSGAFDQVEADRNTYILVVTRGHKHDQAATEAALQTEACYVGLVGSRRKIKIIVEALLEKGLSPSLFDRLYAPIGLPIGSESPEEIAVSVAAELIALRKGVHERSEKQRFVLDLLSS